MIRKQFVIENVMHGFKSLYEYKVEEAKSCFFEEIRDCYFAIQRHQCNSETFNFKKTE